MEPKGPRKLCGTRLWHKGLTLLEAAMVIAIAAVVAASVTKLYVYVNRIQKVAETISVIGALVQGIHEIYGISSTYTGLDTNSIRSESFVPVRYKGTANHGLDSPIGDGSQIYAYVAAGDASNFLMTITALDEEFCLALVVEDLGSRIKDVRVADNPTEKDGGGKLKNTSGSSVLAKGIVSPAAGIKQCRDHTKNGGTAALIYVIK